MKKKIKEKKSSVLPLCYYGHPALTRKSKDILSITNDIVVLAQKMIATMYACDGIGLAAPQVNYNVNMFVLDVSQQGRENSDISFTSPGEANLVKHMPLVFINPMIKKCSEKTVPYVEGCLSIPEVNLEISRPEFVHVSATTITGEKVEEDCGGLLSRCLQHEYDHLQGVLFTDLVSTETFNALKPKLKQIKKQYSNP